MNRFSSCFVAFFRRDPLEASERGAKRRGHVRTSEDSTDDQ